MADPIGEAFIRIRPLFTTFAAEVEAGIKRVSILNTGLVLPITPVITGEANIAALAGEAEALAATQLAASEETAALNAAVLGASISMGELAAATKTVEIALLRINTILGPTTVKVEAATAANAALAASLDAVAASAAAAEAVRASSAITAVAPAGETAAAASAAQIASATAPATVATEALATAIAAVDAAATAADASISALVAGYAAVGTAAATAATSVETLAAAQRTAAATSVAPVATAAAPAAATAATAATTGAVAGNAELAAAITALTAATEASTAASAELAGALAAESAQAGQAAAATGVAATEAANLSKANTAAAASTIALGNAAGRGVTHMHNAAGSAGALRGAVIGLSRITPVAVFGLGLAGTAAIAAGLAFRKAISDAAQFQQQLNVFQTVAHATAREMEAVRAESIALGKDISLPATSANDAATAMTELSKAGLSVADSLAAARGVLQLAAAAGTSAGDAAKITAAALNAFALSGQAATHVADLLAAASVAAQGEISDMANALSQSAAVAAQANVSIEDTTTAISLLAKNGLLGSDAGTSLRTTILRLVPTTKEAAQFTKALGISFQDAAGNLRPLPQIFQQYHDALADLPQTLQQATLQQIFGQDAIRAASILTREGAAGFREMKDEVNRSGAAAELAAAKSKGLSGAVAALASNAETLGTNIGTSLIPELKRLVDNLNAVVTAANKAFDALQKLTSFTVPGTDNKVGRGFDDFIRQNILSPFGFEATTIKLANDVFGGTSDNIKQTTQDAQAFTDTIRGGLQPAFAGLLGDINAVGVGFAGVRVAIDLEDRAAATKQQVAQISASFDKLVTDFRGSLRLLGGLGVKSEAAAPVRDIVLAMAAQLKKLGPEGEAAIRDLPPRLAAIFRQLKQQLLAQADFTIPIRFDIQTDLASLTPTLTDDLRRATERENFLQGAWDKILASGKTGTKRAKQVADALAQAHSQRQAILAQIRSDQKQEADDQANTIRQGIANTQQQLETALVQATSRGAQAQAQAQRALVNFFRRESRDMRLTESERLRFANEAAEAQNNLNDFLNKLAQDRKQTIFNLKELDLQNAALRAQLTPSNADNIRNARDQVKFYRDAAKAVGLQTEEGKRLLGQMIQAQITLKNIVNQAQGESPDVFVNRLFSEAADQFRRFGSNITEAATGILSPQSTRGEFAGLLLGNQTAQRTRDEMLSEEKKQTGYLQIIAGGPRRVVTGTKVPPSVAATVADISANVLRSL